MTLAVQARRPSAVQGLAFPTHRFTVHESERHVTPDHFQALLSGYAAALVVRGYLPAECSRGLAVGFERALRRSRQDDVPAFQIGAGHYGKSLRGYLSQSRRTQLEMRKAFAEAGLDLSVQTSEDLQRAACPGQVVRPAQHKGCSVTPLRAAAWSGQTSGFALDAHEDEQQLRDPRQRGFEIQQVVVPVAVNFYARMPAFGGALRVWNSQPSLGCKAEMGVVGKGYPYRQAAVEGIPYIDVQPEPGDLVLLNGRFLHAVVGWEGSPLQRIVYNGFVGQTVDGATILRWA